METLVCEVHMQHIIFDYLIISVQISHYVYKLADAFLQTGVWCLAQRHLYSALEIMRLPISFTEFPLLLFTEFPKLMTEQSQKKLP